MKKIYTKLKKTSHKDNAGKRLTHSYYDNNNNKIIQIESAFNFIINPKRHKKISFIFFFISDSTYMTDDDKKNSVCVCMGEAANPINKKWINLPKKKLAGSTTTNEKKTEEQRSQRREEKANGNLLLLLLLLKRYCLIVVVDRNDIEPYLWK